MTSVKCSPFIANPLFVFHCDDGQMAVTTIYQVVQTLDYNEQIEYIELEHYDKPVDKLALKAYGPSYDLFYSSFTYVPTTAKSSVVHEYYPQSGTLSYYE